MLLLVLACAPAKDVPLDTSSDTPGDTSTDTSGDTSSDTSGAGPAVGVSLRVNEQVASVLYVDWTATTAGDAHVEYSFDDGVWATTPTHPYEAGPAEQIVLGVPFGATVTWRLVVETADGPWSSPDATHTVDPLPDSFPLPTRVEGEAARWDAGEPYFYIGMNEEGSDFSGPWWTFVMDRQGRPVWALPTPAGFVSMHSRVSADGRAFLVDHNSYWGQFDGGAASEVARVNIEGVEEELVPTPGLHHPFTQLPDGSLAWGVMSNQDETLEVRTPDGVQTSLWSCGDLLESLGMRRQCGSNTLYYDPDTNHFLYSFYSVDTVFEIDAASGALVRSLGAVPGSYTFDPPDSEWWWQHGVNLLADGHLLISTHMTRSGGEATVAREFTIDEASQTLHQVWSFGTAEDLWIYGENMGEAWRLPGGNTLQNYGSVASMREATPEGEVVWQVDWSRYHTIGRSTPIADLYAFVAP